MLININDDNIEEIVFNALQEMITSWYDDLFEAINENPIGAFSIDITEEKLALVKKIMCYENVASDFTYGYKPKLMEFLKAHDIEQYSHYEELEKITEERNKYLKESEILQEELDELKQKLQGLIS